jgi:tripartite-type tricarboxylate transporter receptor subunit TctC
LQGFARSCSDALRSRILPIAENTRSAADFSVFHGRLGYRGDAHQMNDLLAGTLDCILVGGATGLAVARSGRAKIIGWTGETRLPSLPDQPTFNEHHPGLVAVTWFGLLAPARTPPAAVARLNAAGAAAVADATLRERLLAEGILAAGGSPADFQAFLTREAERWGPLLRRLDIRLN